MTEFSNDTIVATATPWGKGSVGVIRVSGDKARAIMVALLGKPIEPRRAHYLPFRDADRSVLDAGIALFFPAPQSFTGEDVLELQGHSSPVALDLLVRRIVSLGARLARPGEFSERAFLNDKIDLTQAEAIADLIECGTEQAARSALRSLQGEFSRLVDAMVDELIDLRMYVEASIDFVDEEIDFMEEGQIRTKILNLLQNLNGIQRSAKQGCILRDGLTVVIAGRPNVGKSSLLNALAGRETAIVTEIEGTTRDLLREYIQIDGMPLHIVDTAGLRDGADLVEREGIRRAREAIARADRVLLVLDDSQSDTSDDLVADLPNSLPITRIRNKIDLSGGKVGFRESERGAEIALSVKTGEGLDELRRHLKACAGYDSEAGNVFIARRRHMDGIRRAHEALENGLLQIETGLPALELVAEDLHQAQCALSEITGAFTNDDLLNRVFGSFCIGK